jgi:hypothetical protein
MKDIDNELDEIIYASERGVGFGGGVDQEREMNKRIQVLMHRQNLEIKKKDTYIAVFNVVLAFINIALVVYQVFFVR